MSQPHLFEASCLRAYLFSLLNEVGLPLVVASWAIAFVIQLSVLG